MSKLTDFIIVGGGSSGALIAAHLVNDLGASVTLLEAGAARGSWLLDLPAGYMKFLNSDKYLRYYESVPQPQLGDRRVIIPQGKILGGGSAVNAMVYMRGQAQDYDAWNAAAGGGWSYDDLLPHFKAVESNHELGEPWHGTAGPIKVSHLGRHDGVSHAFVDACVDQGIAKNHDFNGASQAGVGFMQHTIDGIARRRSSTAKAYLHPLKSHSKLKIITNAAVKRLTMEKDRVVGLSYEKDGQKVDLRAGHEVILCAGALATPTLLMRSGIGPEADLKAAGIETTVALQKVGENLQDHCEVPIVATLARGLGYFGQDRGWRMIRHGLEYVMRRTGVATTTGVEACAFVSSAGQGRPDLQIYCVPTVYLDRTVTGADATWGVTLSACLLRPESRGNVRLNPNDPDGMPLVDPAYLRAQNDVDLMLSGLEISRRILRAQPLAEIVSDEIFPTPDQTDKGSLLKHTLATVKTNYHPVGTCAIGQVVDSELQVKGVDGLRIADASVIPQIPSGNTNAPVMALAHRAAEIITEMYG